MISELSREFLARAHKYGALLLDGEYVLSSGVVSPVYFNGKKLIEGGSGLVWCEEFLFRFLKDSGIVVGQKEGLDFNAIFGPAYGAIPYSLLLPRMLYEKYGRDVQWLFDRKERKVHGEEGGYVGTTPRKGMRVLVVEDAVTSGRTLRVRIQEIVRFGVEISGVLVLFDRQEFEFLQSACVSEDLEEYLGVPVISVATMTDLMEFLGELGQDERLERILKYREFRRREYERSLEIEYPREKG